jgi:hypothetical protein
MDIRAQSKTIGVDFALICSSLSLVAQNAAYRRPRKTDKSPISIARTQVDNGTRHAHYSTVFTNTDPNGKSNTISQGEEQARGRLRPNVLDFRSFCSRVNTCTLTTASYSTSETTPAFLNS